MVKAESRHERIILGIDPGTRTLGYALVRVKGNKASYIDDGELKLHTEEDHLLRLSKIFEQMIILIDQYHPDELSVEEPFYGKNVQSMLKLGRAQGMVIAAALSRKIPVFMYSPRRIKQSITGNGAASKEQVAKMVFRLLDLPERKRSLDSTDALAIALSHCFQSERNSSANIPSKKSSRSKPASNWEGFIRNNPDRI